MAKRGYSSEENTVLAELAKRFSGGENHPIPNRSWPKVRRAFRKKFPIPNRTAGALAAQYYRTAHLGGHAQKRGMVAAWERFKAWGERTFERYANQDRELAVFRSQVQRLKKEARENRVRADNAETKLRRLVVIVQGTRRRAESALVEHSKD